LGYLAGMPAETDVWADVVADVVSELDALLRGIPAGAWESPAANVGWSCWLTADHISGDFAHYAAQIIGQPRDHYVKPAALRTLLVQTGRDRRSQHEPPRVWSYGGAAALPLSSGA
jgi:hypothetical protein